MLGVHQKGGSRADSVQVWVRILPKTPPCRDSQMHLQLLCSLTGETDQGQPSDLKGQTRTHFLKAIEVKDYLALSVIDYDFMSEHNINNYPQVLKKVSLENLVKHKKYDFFQKSLSLKNR